MMFVIIYYFSKQKQKQIETNRNQQVLIKHLSDTHDTTDEIDDNLQQIPYHNNTNNNNTSNNDNASNIELQEMRLK